MERVSVFGSSGFVGSNYCRLYPNETIAIESNSEQPLSRDVLYMRSTTHNYNVFHDDHLDIDVNLTLLMDVLPRVDGTFNFLSSWFVYAPTLNPAHETSPCLPNGFYSATKFCAENLTRSYCETFGRNYRILRLCNIVGGDIKASQKKNALEHMIRRLKNNEEVFIYEGDNYRNFLDIEDCCRAIKLILDVGNVNDIYNIGHPNSFRIIDLINYAATKLNRKNLVKMIPQPDFHKTVQVKDFFMNTEKLKLLGFKPKLDIWQTIDKILSHG